MIDMALAFLLTDPGPILDQGPGNPITLNIEKVPVLSKLKIIPGHDRGFPTRGIEGNRKDPGNPAFASFEPEFFHLMVNSRILNIKRKVESIFG
jgi:hypothetical protein